MTKIPIKYEIDDGVEVPIRRLPIAELDVGQSFEFPLRQRASVNSIASRLKSATGKQFTVKTLDKQTCRIWRIK